MSLARLGGRLFGALDFLGRDESLNAKETIKYLKANEQTLFIIHYSCQNLNDNNENYSLRITSIAVLHVGSSSMHSFSIHLAAEIKNYDRDDIDKHYDELELEMLEEFYSLVKENSGAFWLHWNMSNINFGFETLAHRYKVLSKKDAPRIEDSRKFNLISIILSLYGANCVDHPRMQKLMELNDGIHRDVLTGKEEVEAFQNKEYIKLHKSTMSKVYWFKSMYYRVLEGKVVTQRSNWGHKVNHFLERPTVRLLGFIAVLFSLFQLGQMSYEKYQSSNQVKEKSNNTIERDK